MNHASKVLGFAISLKVVLIIIFSALISSCGMSSNEKEELAQLRRDQAEQRQKALEIDQQQKFLALEQQRKASILEEQRLEQQRLAQEIMNKELKKKEAEERENIAIEKIQNNLQFDIKSTLARKQVCASKIENVNGKTTINDRDDDSKYFVASVNFDVSCNLLFVSNDKKYVGKWYYDKIGNYKSAEWKQMSNEFN